MNLWRNLPERLVEGLPLWKSVYVVFFAVDMTVANLLVNLNTARSMLQVTLVFLASVIILTVDFTRRVASGHRLLQPTPEANHRLRWYLCYYVLTRYIFVPLVALAGFGVFVQLADALLPAFSSDQQLGVTTGSVGMDLLIAFLGSLEEYWRWATITAVLLAARLLGTKLWATNRAYRNAAMAIGVLISSLLFGLAHAPEFTVYRGWSVIVLGAMGLGLALVAIVTRRFVIAVILHFLYDFIATTNVPAAVMLVLTGAAAMCLVVLLPLFWLWYRRVRPHLNISRVSRAST